MKIGVIGGSGLYQFQSQGEEEVDVETPFGKTSDTIYKSTVGPNTLFFMSRHGKGHRISPSEINYKANIFAFKKLGVTRLLSVSAVGSLKKEIVPGEFVLPDQYLDRTKSRASTYFEGGIVGHAHFAVPHCSSLLKYISKKAESLKIKTHKGGTYVCMEGPQFSTKAESHWYRSMNASVIGMTALPEAKLAREAGLCYQTLAMATDYDCWNEEAKHVELADILAVLNKNVESSRQLVKSALSEEFPPCQSHCHQAMKDAIVTAKEHWPENKRSIVEILLS